MRDKKLEGISDLRNESDRDGMRIVIELKRDAIPRVVLNQLYKHTAMQATFGVIMLALVPDATTGSLVPKVMPLKEMLEHYIAHRHEVIVRRTQFDLDKALEREHILEGLKIAVDNIDEVIKLIRAAADTPTASTQLQKRFKLIGAAGRSDPQHAPRQAHRPRDREARGGAQGSAARSSRSCARCSTRSDKRMKVLKDELTDVAKKFGDERRTEITSDEGEFTIEDLIAEEEMVVTISHSGYIKRTSVVDVPAAAARRTRQQRRDAQGRGFHRAPLRGVDARLHPGLHRRRPLLLAQGARDPAGRARGQGQADRQPDQRVARHEGLGDS